MPFIKCETCCFPVVYFITSYVLYTCYRWCCSKSEYVRCIRFTRENILFVATNNGYLYHAELSNPGNVKWTELIQVSEAQIICIDILSRNFSEFSLDAEEIVAIGDGNGKVTVVSLTNGDHAPKVSLSFSWSAEMERQLLGVHWCRSLGSRYGNLIFIYPFYYSNVPLFLNFVFSIMQLPFYIGP